ncbi:MAG: LysR family transcriptional regulator [Myxococcota bacterium]
MDKLDAMQSFIRVVECGSFSRTARETGTTQPTISKRIAFLEEVLGARLLVRTSRSMELTEVGAAYYERCLSILAEIETAEVEVNRLHNVMRGTLRVSAPDLLGNHFISPRLPGFLAQHPNLMLNLNLTNRQVDIIAEGFDVAVRVGSLKDSSLVAQKLASVRAVLVASPSYLNTHGLPQSPLELSSQNCLIYSHGASSIDWVFHDGQESPLRVTVSGNLATSNALVLKQAAIAGVGIAMLSTFMVEDEIAAGVLKPVSFDGYTCPAFPLFAVYPVHRFVPVKVRRWIEFLKQEFSQEPALHSPR